MYRCESWTIRKSEHRRIDAFELWCWIRLWKVPLDSKEIKPVNPKGNQPWILIGRTDAEAPILWPPDAKRRHIGKDPDAGKDWGQMEKGVAENEKVGSHHWLSGHKFVQSLGESEGQGRLPLCIPWGRKELDRLNDRKTTMVLAREMLSNLALILGNGSRSLKDPNASISTSSPHLEWLQNLPRGHLDLQQMVACTHAASVTICRAVTFGGKLWIDQFTRERSALWYLSAMLEVSSSFLNFPLCLGNRTLRREGDRKWPLVFGIKTCPSTGKRWRC